MGRASVRPFFWPAAAHREARRTAKKKLGKEHGVERGPIKVNVRDVLRVIACVAMAALVSQLAPHVVSTTRYDDLVTPDPEMPVIARVPEANGTKRRMIVRWDELAALRDTKPGATLLLDTRAGRILLDGDPGSTRQAQFEVEEYPKGQWVTLTVHETGVSYFSAYRVEGAEVRPVSLRVVRHDHTTYALLGGLVFALAAGRFPALRRKRVVAASSAAGG